jgi:DNA-binding NarL/FixJ family response regulator
MPKHIIIADNHTETCLQIETEIRKVYPIIKVTIAENGGEVLQIHEKESAEVIIMDIGMPLIDGIEATQIIKRKYNNVKIILTSTQKEPIFLLSMMIHGANGFVQKNCNHQGYYEAIECVLGGDPYFPEEIKELYKPRHSEKKINEVNVNTEDKISFTMQQLRVLSLIKNGNTTAEIASFLNVEPSTIATHKKHIYSKIGTKNIAEIIAFALKKGY